MLIFVFSQQVTEPEKVRHPAARHGDDAGFGAMQLF
jgi:hypothetical protein